jgi:hypothetical protein
MSSEILNCVHAKMSTKIHFPLHRRAVQTLFHFQVTLPLLNPESSKPQKLWPRLIFKKISDYWVPK